MAFPIESMDIIPRPFQNDNGWGLPSIGHKARLTSETKDTKDLWDFSGGFLDDFDEMIKRIDLLRRLWA